MICWICKKTPANSAEHKFKSSQLKRMHGRSFLEKITIGNEFKEQLLQGPKSEKVKFPKVICEECNNDKTSSHDRAFDRLINWTNKNYKELEKMKTIDFRLVYGENWVDEKMNLLKYMAKHAGCKIVTGQIQNDVNKLSKLIYNDVKTTSFHIGFIVKEAFNYLDLIIKSKGSDGLKFISNSGTVCRKTSKNEIVYFAGMTTYNWFSIIWVFTQNNHKTVFDGFDNQIEDVFFLPFSELPEKNKNQDWFDFIDKQNIELIPNQVSIYDEFIK
ncbi:MAG: hypothetical protein ACI81T_001048 [Bacteroidia bacterium]|jgi:hypothetical protein